MFVAELIPLTFFLEYFRQFYGFEPTFHHVLAKGYIMVFFYLFMEVLLLKLAIRKAKKRGTLLKLSE
jgi:ABC-2 type transport system permease protein